MSTTDKVAIILFVTLIFIKMYVYVDLVGTAPTSYIINSNNSYMLSLFKDVNAIYIHMNTNFLFKEGITLSL